MSWAHSLIRIREFEIETLRKRLAVIMDAKTRAELGIALLDAEADSETAHVRQNVEGAWCLAGFREGWKIRHAKAVGDLKAVEMEEQGCRDALSEAFAELKKIEHVAETQTRVAAKTAARRENAVLDEIALRRTGS